MNNQLFLDLYKKLELFLDGKYHYAESPIKEYINHLERSMVSEDIEKASELDFLRILRNHLVHRNVSHFFEVTDDAIEFLKKEIDIFENPIEAKDVMIPIKKVYYVYLDDELNEVLHQIYVNSYDILPILDDQDKVIGVFSLDVILKDLHDNKDSESYKNSTLRRFSSLISLYEQTKERFDFVGLNDNLDEIMNRFNKKSDKKLKMIFVTKDGLKNQPLLGIITPHDVIYKKR